MSAVVPYKRTETRIGDILIGEPVRAQTWRETAMLLHWLRAHGMHVIPAHAPQMQLTATSTPESLFYRIQPQGLAIARVWVIVLRQEEPTGPPTPAFVDVTLPNATVSRQSPGLGAHRAILFEALSSKSAAQADVELIFERTSGSANVWIESVSCYELPRGVLTLNTTDYGVDFETVRPGAALIDGDNGSIGAIAENLTRAISWPRRMLWQQSFPLIDSDPGGAGNPTSAVDLFELPIPVLPRRVAVGDTTFQATWNIRAVCEGAGDTFVATITSGNNSNTDTIQFAGVTTEAWGTNGTIELDCEDVSKVDGVPSGGLETVQIAVHRTAGTGKVSVRSVALWEAS
jgi:hypothetical protein